VNAKPSRTAYELTEMIVERARGLHGPWPAGMTMFIFDDAYGWNASISRPMSEVENFYRTQTLDLISKLRSRYDLASPCLSSVEDTFNCTRFRLPIQSRSSTRRSMCQKVSKGAIAKPRNPKKRRSR
jgi:hypothetical protein